MFLDPGGVAVRVPDHGQRVPGRGGGLRAHGLGGEAGLVEVSDNETAWRLIRVFVGTGG